MPHLRNDNEKLCSGCDFIGAVVIPHSHSVKLWKKIKKKNALVCVLLRVALRGIVSGESKPKKGTSGDSVSELLSGMVKTERAGLERERGRSCEPQPTI